MSKIEFTAKLQQVKDLDAANINFPYNVQDLFGTKGRVKIKANIDSVDYRGLLANMGTGCHILGIKKEIRKRINKQIGDSVDIIIEQDIDENIFEIPFNFKKILKKIMLHLIFIRAYHIQIKKSTSIE